MRKSLPVYKINQFNADHTLSDFYSSYFSEHIKQHQIAHIPHKHDFFLVVLFTAGSGTHDIDFITYPITPGTVFMISPGQMHRWNLSKDIDGYVFFHTRDFYDKGFTTERVQNYPFFRSIHHPPFVKLTKKAWRQTAVLFEEIIGEYRHAKWMTFEKLHSLITLVYIELSRQYQLPVKIENENYLTKLRKLEDLINRHFKTIKSPSEYATLMNMSEKHVNRISKTCVNKTTSGLIAERVVLEAKRLLIHPTQSIEQIAGELGYEDHSYFSRFFKKHVGESPTSFAARYKAITS